MTLLSTTTLILIAVTATLGCTPKETEPQILVEPKSQYIHKVGDKVSIVCAAHATPTPVVYWMKKIGNRNREVGGRANGISVLYFDSIEKDEFGLYTCVISACCSKKANIKIPVDIIVPQEPDCNKKYGNSSLIFGVDWTYAKHDEAKRNCEKFGMKLALIHSEKENERLLKDAQISFDRHPNARKFDGDNWIWIAGTDREEEGKWVDLYTNKRLTYFNWDKPNQPDNWIGNEGTYYYNPGGQDYLAFSRVTGKWDDSFATHPRPYACRCPKRVGK